MTAGHVFIATSLDGFIADADGGIDWLHALPDIGDDYGHADFMAGMDGVIMGSGTFEKVLTFGMWPFTVPVVVMSQRLGPVPEHLAGKVSIRRETPAELMTALSEEGWRHAYVDGGKLISSFLAAGLIEDMIISRIPVLLGSGLPLFSGLTGPIPMEHVATRAYSSGLVQSRYQVRRSGTAA